MGFSKDVREMTNKALIDHHAIASGLLAIATTDAAVSEREDRVEKIKAELLRRLNRWE